LQCDRATDAGRRARDQGALPVEVVLIDRLRRNSFVRDLLEEFRQVTRRHIARTSDVFASWGFAYGAA
jgi:hypothetical protein